MGSRRHLSPSEDATDGSGVIAMPGATAARVVTDAIHAMGATGEKDARGETGVMGATRATDGFSSCRDRDVIHG